MQIDTLFSAISGRAGVPSINVALKTQSGISWVILGAILLSACVARADILPGNIWPNPTLESVSSTPGIPSYWHQGGSDATIDQWPADDSVSPSHALKLNDTSADNYGEWYSDRISAVAGATYAMRYYLKYETTGSMRVTVNFADADNANLSPTTFAFSDSQTDWTAMDQTFTAPDTAATMWITFASGGGADTTGTASLDDISLVNQSGGTNDTNSLARVLPAAFGPNIVVDGNPGDWASLSSGVLNMDTQGRGTNGTMAVDIRYAWDATNLYILVQEDTNKYTASIAQEASDAAAYQAAPWSMDTIAFWIDLGNDAGTTVDGSPVTEPNADFQPWFGFSSSGRTDLMYARENNSGTMNLDGLANARVATGGTFAQHNRVIEAALRWTDLATAVDVSRQPGGNLVAAIAAGYTFGCEPLLIYHDFNSQSFLGPDQWNAPSGVDTNSIDVQLVASAPRVSIVRAGSQWEILWPVSAAGYNLESSPQLGTGAVWTVVPASPLTDGTMNTVTFTPSGSAMYYRLRK